MDPKFKHIVDLSLYIFAWLFVGFIALREICWLIDKYKPFLIGNIVDNIMKRLGHLKAKIMSWLVFF